MRKVFLPQNAKTRIRTTLINRVLILACIVAVSCNQQVKKEKEKETPKTNTHEILKGHMDSVDGKALWVFDNPAYEADAFDHSRSEYASVIKMDGERNPLGMGLINRKGEIVVPVIYDGLEVGLEGGYCVVTKNNKRGMVNAEGKEIVPPQYEYIDAPIEGLFRVGKDDKYGIINIKGEIIIPIVYAQVTPAKEGMIAFMNEPQRWGYLNLKNEVVIKPEFTFSAAFENGKVILQKPDGEDYIVYKDGRVEKK
jgi:WG repeat protein